MKLVSNIQCLGVKHPWSLISPAEHDSLNAWLATKFPNYYIIESMWIQANI